jgi:hypothetical protein
VRSSRCRQAGAGKRVRASGCREAGAGKPLRPPMRAIPSRARGPSFRVRSTDWADWADWANWGAGTSGIPAAPASALT